MKRIRSQDSASKICLVRPFPTYRGQLFTKKEKIVIHESVAPPSCISNEGLIARLQSQVDSVPLSGNVDHFRPPSHEKTHKLSAFYRSKQQLPAMVIQETSRDPTPFTDNQTPSAATGMTRSKSRLSRKPLTNLNKLIKQVDAKDPSKSLRQTQSLHKYK